MTVLIWLAIMVLCLVVEAITVGLTTIWFAVGALAAMISCALGLGTVGQFMVFFVVSLILLIFTRPVAVKYINPHKVATNYEEAVEKTVKITERVDNISGTGVAVLKGQEWSARMQQDDITLEVGALAKVVAIEGVKLILVPLADE